MEPNESFRYPDGRLMCRDGQDRAAQEAWKLLQADEAAEAEIIKRAVKAEWALARGADTNKPNLISWVVALLFKNGEIRKFVDPKTGEYTVTSPSGRMSVKRRVRR